MYRIGIFTLALVASAPAVSAQAPSQGVPQDPRQAAKPERQGNEALRQEVLREARRVSVPALIRDLRRCRGRDARGVQLVRAHVRLLQFEEERGRLSWAREALQKLDSKPEVEAKLSDVPSIAGAEEQQTAHDALLAELELSDDALRAAISLREMNALVKRAEAVVEGLQAKELHGAESGGEGARSGSSAPDNSNYESQIKELEDEFQARNETAKRGQPKEPAEPKQDYDYLKKLKHSAAPGRHS